MPKKTPPKLLTITEVAELLGTSRQAVWDAIRKNRLKAERYGHALLIPRAAALAYNKSRRPGGPAPKGRAVKK